MNNRSFLPPLGTYTQARSNRKLILWSLHSPTLQLEKVMTKTARGLQLKAELQTPSFHSRASASGILWVLTTVLNVRLLTCVRWSTSILKNLSWPVQLLIYQEESFSSLGFQRVNGKYNQSLATPNNSKENT